MTHYVDYQTNEIVHCMVRFGEREFDEVKREPFTQARLATLKSMEEAFEAERIKIPLLCEKKTENIVGETISHNMAVVVFLTGLSLGIVFGWMIFNTTAMKILG